MTLYQAIERKVNKRRCSALVINLLGGFQLAYDEEADITPLATCAGGPHG